MIGCCASSPSKKKPNTTSPGEILTGFALPDFPEPVDVGSMTCAQGKSLSFNSVRFGG